MDKTGLFSRRKVRNASLPLTSDAPKKSQRNRPKSRATEALPCLILLLIFYFLHRNQELAATTTLPRIVSFTHYRDLLQEVDDPELQYLRDNVLRIKELHPEATVNFYTDQECVESLQRTEPKLVSYFENEKEGMYKADICRGSILYEHGGLYFDVDLGVREDIFGVLKPTTTFATVVVHLESQHKGAFFQAFMAATPEHPVIAEYLDSFLAYYEGRLSIEGPLGVVLLRHAYDTVVERDPKVRKTTELWQEVKYAPEFRKSYFKHVPPPTWGTRRACKFVVVSDKDTMRVPMYSRIAGSRMCPTEPLDKRYLDNEEQDTDAGKNDEDSGDSDESQGKDE